MILLACEGNTEVRLMRRLLDEEALVFRRRDIIDREPIHLRQLDAHRSVIALLPFHEPIDVYRIGDTLKDEFRWDPNSRRAKEGLVHITKYCTKPESEILPILVQGWFADYEKKRLSPKDIYGNSALVLILYASLKKLRLRRLPNR